MNSSLRSLSIYKVKFNYWIALADNIRVFAKAWNSLVVWHGANAQSRICC